jgi:ElaB/YqjD/DUF883 family membrane-anchored ribosome-binding protein
MEPTSTRGSTEQTIERASSGAHEAIERAAQTASHYAEEWLEMKDNWVEGAREYVREHPVAALGIAVAAGYILSMLMRSRD